MSPLVVIGAPPGEVLPAQVCAFTIREHASCEVDVRVLSDADVGMAHRKSPTGFSMVRFAVPAQALYAGRALYLDSDMLVFADVANALSVDLEDAVLARPQDMSAVIVWDCADPRARFDLAKTKNAAADAVFAELFKRDDYVLLAGECNETKAFTAETKIFHFTDMCTQPWRVPRDRAHPLSHLWYDALCRAVQAGAIGGTLIADEIHAGRVQAHVMEELHASLSR